MEGNNLKKNTMFKKLKEMFRQYKEYVRVDLIMYGVLISMIIIYILLSVLSAV